MTDTLYATSESGQPMANNQQKRVGRFRATSFWSGLLSVVLVVISAVLAFRSHSWQVAERHAWGKAIVGMWVIGPPVWFWVEWSFLSFNLGPEELENLKHSQEVARNIWVAVVVLLTAIFGIPSSGT